MRSFNGFILAAFAISARCAVEIRAEEELGPTVIAVQGILSSEHPDIRHSYSWTDVQVAQLARLEGRTEVTAELVRVLGDRTASERWRSIAGDALTLMRPVSQEARAAMAKQMHAPLRPVDRVRGIRALGGMQADAEPWIDSIARLKDAPDRQVRIAVCLALTDIGRATDYRHPSIDATLLAAVDDPEAVVRREAVQCFCRRKLDAALPKLREHLSDPADEVRGIAAFAVWQTAGDAETTLPILMDLLGGVDSESRVEAAYLLQYFGAEAVGALPQLKVAVEFDSEPPFAKAEDSLRYRLKTVARETIRSIEKGNRLAQ
jgi:HEAT repeat protein